MDIKKIIIVEYTFEIIFLIVISFIYYLNQPISTSKVIYIPKGSISKIITHLSDKESNLNQLDSFILRFIGSPQSGWINIGETKITKGDFLYKLTTAKAALQNVTLIPGETTFIFLNQLAKNLNLDRKKLENEYNQQTYIKEGAFIPDTYRLPVGITEKRLIEILLSISKKKMQNLSFKFFGSFNEKKWFHYVAIASIIQKESANKNEMPIVSSVIYNRIKKGMKLQMDGTLNYGKYSHIKVTSKRILEDNSIFNTYKIKGIPIIPVCNVSFDAIRAAIFPTKTKYLYFMKSKNGTHNFSSNYSTHLYNIRRATK